VFEELKTGVHCGPGQEECYLNPYAPHFYGYRRKITESKVLQSRKLYKN